MTTEETLPEFLLARIADDETWANACEGLHWEWRTDVDDLVKPDPFAAECIDEDADVSLRSVEEFPYRSIPGRGPRFLIHTAQEVRATVAGHIIRHDPARVLAECEAKRRIVALHDPCDDWSYGDPATCPELAALAAVYADHPDFREEWLP